AFTAFHWLDPDRRFEKSARLLREDGHLVVVATRHVLPSAGDPFWVEVQEDYDAVVPDPANRAPGPPEEVADLSSEFAASGCFETAWPGWTDAATGGLDRTRNRSDPRIPRCAARISAASPASSSATGDD